MISKKHHGIGSKVFVIFLNWSIVPIGWVALGRVCNQRANRVNLQKKLNILDNIWTRVEGFLNITMSCKLYFISSTVCFSFLNFYKLADKKFFLAAMHCMQCSCKHTCRDRPTHQPQDFKSRWGLRAEGRGPQKNPSNN